ILLDRGDRRAHGRRQEGRQAGLFLVLGATRLARGIAVHIGRPGAALAPLLTVAAVLAVVTVLALGPFRTLAAVLAHLAIAARAALEALRALGAGLAVVVGEGLAADIRLGSAELVHRRLALSLAVAEAVALLGVEVVALVVVRPLEAAVGRLQLRLRRCDDAEIMFRVLEVILGRDRIAGSLGVTRQLAVFLGDMLGGATHLHVRTVRLVASRQRVGTLAVAPPHTPVLTWSHLMSL